MQNTEKLPKRRNSIRKSPGEKIFDGFNIVLMLVITIMCFYPVWYVFIIAMNDAQDAIRGGIFFWPRVWTFDNILHVFRDGGIVRAFQISIARTLLGTFVSVFFTAMVSYGMSKANLLGRKYYYALGLITMFFSGGLIPTFLLYRDLGLLDNFLVYIFPGMFSFFNLLIFTSFFRTIPASVEESAKIDGANDFRIFLSIVIPLSKPVLATIALFSAVGHWNDFFSGLIFVTRVDLEPVQTFLFRIINQANFADVMGQGDVTVLIGNITATSVRMATMFVTIVPIILVYPFLQKYFIKGMLLGAVKE